MYPRQAYLQGVIANFEHQYIIGSTFSTISAATDPEDQVSSSDLTAVLSQLFSGARDHIVSIGQLATGQNGDYSLLPNANGTGNAPPLADNSYIAGFFSDGKTLLAQTNPVFNQSIENGFGQFKAKIVDQALQTAGYSVFALTNFLSESACFDSDSGAGYGAQWLSMSDGSPYCMQLFQDNHGSTCGVDVGGTCDVSTVCERFY